MQTRPAQKTRKEIERGFSDVAGRVWRHGEERSWPQTVKDREKESERERKRGRRRERQREAS